ncbi:hypothetical protein L0222_29590, partial [bacterium]|nr:hypothetical protein [bacterium]
TSDHGEAFGEHGEVSHSLFVYNTTLRIPLMIAGPGIPTQRHPEIVRIIDIFPTVAEIMGWKVSSAIDGVSLLPLLRGGEFQPLESYAETFATAIDFGWSPLACIQDAQFKYVHAPKPEMYDLKLDPGEIHNLAAKKQTATYESKVKSLLAARKSGSEYKPPPEEIERLRSLGYMAGTPQKVTWDAPDPKDKIQVAQRIAELTMKPMPSNERAKAYAEIVRLDPTNPLLLVRFGEISLQIKDFAEAERTFLRAIELGYPSAAPYNGLAAAYFYQERNADAEAILRKAVDAGVADGETYFNLAEFLYNRGLTQEAFTYYDRSTLLGHKLAAQRKAELKSRR